MTLKKIYALNNKKRVKSGNIISKSDKKTKRFFKMNIQKKKIFNGLNFFSLRISCNDIRILKKINN